MSNSPSFRAWADAAHRDSMRPIKPAPQRFKCSKCSHRLTKNQARLSGGLCSHCGAPLRAAEQFKPKETT